MLSHPCRDAFWNAFRKKAHRLFQMGYSSALPDIRKHTREEDISGIIVDHMNRIWESSLCLDAGYSLIRIHNEYPVDDSKRFGKDRFSIDIVIRQPQRGGPAPTLAFEAKRLRTGTHPIGGYTGQDGMGCFLRGDYVPDMPEAAMVGYVQNRDMDYWEQQLACKLAQPLTPTSIVDQLPYEWATTHQREAGTHITIYHIFLDCCPQQPLHSRSVLITSIKENLDAQA